MSIAIRTNIVHILEFYNSDINSTSIRFHLLVAASYTSHRFIPGQYRHTESTT
jgi:hypothetical protein